MRKIERLKVEARAACEWRGHRMSRFTNNRGGTAAYAQCVRRATTDDNRLLCHLFVHVNARPMPNEVKLGGDAVALTCRGGVKKERKVS